MNNFLQRILTGTVFIAVIIVAIWFGPVTFQVLFLWIALLSLEEFYVITRNDKFKTDKTSGLFIATVIYIVLSATAFNEIPGQYEAIIWPFIFLVFIIQLYRKNAQPFSSIALTLVGILYAVIPFILLNKIAAHGLLYNRTLVTGYFILLWSNDSFAYLWGKWLGRNKLFERISPGKTWEGSIGGTLTTIGLAILISHYFTSLATIHWIIIALIICVTGTFGDLVESMLKRSLNIKDSGNFLPGHGGLLDRFDGLLLSVPFVWCYLSLFT